MTVSLTLSDLSLFLITLAVISLMVYLIRLAIVARETLIQAQGLIKNVNLQVANLGDEPRLLLNRVNAISTNLELKLHHTDPLFQVIGDLSEALASKTASLSQKSERQQFKERFSSSSSDQGLGMTDLLECALSIVNVWKKATEEK